MIAILLVLAAAADGGMSHVEATLEQGRPAAFQIASGGREGLWQAKTPDGCRFGVEIPSVKGVFVKGMFLREKGSSCGTFLSRLVAALEGGSVPKVKPTERVEFNAAVLGVDLQRTRGGFSGKGGGWIVTKLFLGEEEAEVFFNFNPKSGEAEFSEKDSDYAEPVLRVLGSVLSPP